jgi:hypothetical protein
MEPRVVKVINLKTGAELTFVGLCPSEAVIAAYAQEHGDWNTWNYGSHKYKPVFGKVTISCGDWSAKY